MSRVRSGDDQDVCRRDQDDVNGDWAFESRIASRESRFALFSGLIAEAPPHRGDEQRMATGADFEPAIRRDCRFGSIDQYRKLRAGLQHVELGCRLHGALEIAATAAERIGQLEQNTTDFLCLLLLERDNVVVDFNRAERLEKKTGAAARAAVHDSGNRGAMFGSNDEHVASIAIRDDLLLQVFRCVLAAQIGFQRAAQAGALFPQSIPHASELRTCVVHDLAGRIDLAADVGYLRVERGRRVSNRAKNRTGAAGASDRRAGHVDRCEK